MRVYLDHNATAPLHPSARAALLAAYEVNGNASSIHGEGQAARALIETARAKIAEFVGGSAKGVIFTSGGTEALNLILTPHIEMPGDRLRPFDRLLASAGEHMSVLSGHRFAPAELELITLTPSGTVDLEALGEALSSAKTRGQRVALALQAANNETGVIQPVAEVAQMVHAADGIVICDAVQAVGKIDCHFDRLGADALILSGHKFGGPKGVGALCFRSDGIHIQNPLLRGGGQERGQRAGTENSAGIAAMAAAHSAAQERLSRESKVHSEWRDEMEPEIARAIPEAVFFGQSAERLPNTSCFALPSIESSVMLMALDLEGFAISSGSACSSGKVQSSHVLEAMRVAADIARGALRASLGWNTQREDVLSFVQALTKSYARIHARRAKSVA